MVDAETIVHLGRSEKFSHGFNLASRRVAYSGSSIIMRLGETPQRPSLHCILISNRGRLKLDGSAKEDERERARQSEIEVKKPI